MSSSFSYDIQNGLIIFKKIILIFKSIYFIFIMKIIFNILLSLSYPYRVNNQVLIIHQPQFVRIQLIQIIVALQIIYKMECYAAHCTMVI